LSFITSKITCDNRSKGWYMCEWHCCLSFFPILKVKQSNVTCELCHDIVTYIQPFVDSTKDKVINAVVTYRPCIFLYTSLAWVFKDATCGLNFPGNICIILILPIMGMWLVHLFDAQSVQRCGMLVLSNAKQFVVGLVYTLG